MGIGAVMLLPKARFDNNPLNVRDPSSESVRTFNELLEKGASSPWSLNAVAPSLESAQLLAERLEALDVVERVVATVNNEAIFLSDLRKRAVPFLPQVAEASTETERMSRLKELYDELLNYLVDEQLIRQLASSSGIRVTDADVDNAIENLRLQNNMTEQEFQQALDGQGFTQGQYRKDLKRQLIRLKVMNERVRSRVNVTEEEVRARYEQRAREGGSELRFQVSHVVVPVGSQPVHGIRTG